MIFRCFLNWCSPQQVERNMRLRRKRLMSMLQPGEIIPTMTCFPLMGVGDFVAAPNDAAGGNHVRGPILNSAYLPDVIVNPHPRFGALAKNIRVRHCRRAHIGWDDSTKLLFLLV